MATKDLLQGLRAGLGFATSTRHIGVQHLGLAGDDVAAVESMLAKLSEQLGVRFELRDDDGDIVLLDGALAERLSPQMIHAFKEERPMVVLGTAGAIGMGDDTSPLRARRDAKYKELRRQDLLRQLRSIDLVRSQVPGGAADAAASSLRRGGAGAGHSGFDSSFDTVIDGDQLIAEELARGQREVLRLALAGALAAEGTMPARARVAPLCASYGPGANLRFDFQQRLVHCDPLALQHLRGGRELPQPAPGARTGRTSSLRDLDDVLWDMGIAAGPLPLQGAPADWWHCPMQVNDALRAQGFTRVPGQLEVIRLLAAGPVTPSELRRQARMGVAELRRVLQACLVLRLAHWLPFGPPLESLDANR